MPLSYSKPRWSIPRRHLILASGCALFFGGLLTFLPSQDANAKRTEVPLQLGNTISSEQRLQAHTSSSTIQPLTTERTQAAQANYSAPAWEKLTINSGDTLSTLLIDAGFTATDVHYVANAGEFGKQLTRIRAGHQLWLKRDHNDALVQLKYVKNQLESILLTRNDDGFQGEEIILEPQVKLAEAQGVIFDSLFLSAQKAGLTDNMTMKLAAIFGYDIDFVMDIREGDQFSLIYEERYLNGEKIGNGEIVAARFQTQSNMFSAVRFTDSKGHTDYYDEKGRSMRKAFLRNPVDFTRISSRFNPNRRHPVLNKIRAHKGVDYAAPTGTPIKAAGDGKIIFASRTRGYGYLIKIQHGQRYETRYAHMNKFAKGMRKGKWVKQGQLIGYVGMTGLVTGPHLHYEFRENGAVRDPLKVKLPDARPVVKQDRKQYQEFANQQLARLDHVAPLQIARKK